MAELIWKCDFCCYTDHDQNTIINHELTCDFNPYMKKCYSCKNSIRDKNNELLLACKIDENTTIGEEEGFCVGWKQKV